MGFGFEVSGRYILDVPEICKRQDVFYKCETKWEYEFAYRDPRGMPVMVSILKKEIKVQDLLVSARTGRVSRGGKGDRTDSFLLLAEM